MAFAETHGWALRETAGVGPEDRLDPIALIARFDAFLLVPEQVERLSAEAREAMDSLSVKAFSGGAQELPDGTLLIIANPKQTRERLHVTIMEEIAHRHLGHEPTTITTGPGGEGKRTYDKEAEDEAYWTAAAALLPRVSVSRAVWQRIRGATIAARFGVSLELVEFRIKTLNLWNHYQSDCPQPPQEPEGGQCDQP